MTDLTDFANGRVTILFLIQENSLYTLVNICKVVKVKTQFEKLKFGWLE